MVERSWDSAAISRIREGNIRGELPRNKLALLPTTFLSAYLPALNRFRFKYRRTCAIELNGLTLGISYDRVRFLVLDFHPRTSYSNINHVSSRQALWPPLGT